MPEIRHVLPVGLRPPKFQSVNPPSLRSIGIPETPDREAVSRIVSAPADVWIVRTSTGTKHCRHWAKNSTSSRCTRHRRSSHRCSAVAARKGRKPKVVRAVATMYQPDVDFKAVPQAFR